ncbi:Ras- protein Rab-34 [Tritrichomonas musculus]|uniref:Ras- protein Rab-34 n=1 Tax=Tritrichomonas musculus TaxID=1915356 RepID=A0ABR2J3L8_9EUKA
MKSKYKTCINFCTIAATCNSRYEEQKPRYFWKLSSFYSRDVDGAIIVFDLNNPETFDEVPSFYDIFEKNDEVPKILVGCKCDLEHQVDSVQIQEIAIANDSKCIEVSADQNVNVNETAQYIISEAF